MIIADTNLIASIMLEQESVAVVRVVRVVEPVWVAPPLWASECRNILSTYVRSGQLSQPRAFDAWRIAKDLVREQEVDAVAVLEMEFGRGISGYDAEFAALAQTLGVPLVTFDRRLRAACPDLALSPEAFVEQAPRSG